MRGGRGPRRKEALCTPAHEDPDSLLTSSLAGGRQRQIAAVELLSIGYVRALLCSEAIHTVTLELQLDKVRHKDNAIIGDHG